MVKSFIVYRTHVSRRDTAKFDKHSDHSDKELFLKPSSNVYRFCLHFSLSKLIELKRENTSVWVAVIIIFEIIPPISNPILFVIGKIALLFLTHSLTIHSLLRTQQIHLFICDCRPTASATTWIFS